MKKNTFLSRWSLPLAGLLFVSGVLCVADAGAETLTLRSRTFSPKLHVLESERSRTALPLELFDDAQYVARVRQSAQSSNERRVWAGALEGYPDSHVSLVVREGRLAGKVQVDNRLFEIVPQPEGRRSLIREIDTVHQEAASCRQLTPPRSNDRVTSQTVQMSSLIQSMETDAKGNTELDLLVFFTNGAQTAAGGREAILGLIDTAVAETNRAFENSRIKARFRLLDAQKIKYKAAPDMAEDLYALTETGDGTMNKAITQRDKKGADFVALIVDEADAGTCGIAWVLNNAPGDVDYAFSVTRYDCLSNMTLAHELGHNMGLMHNREETNSPGWFKYSHGYHDPAGAFRTIMSYGFAQRIPNFANPRVSRGGVPTGVDKSKRDSADAAKSVNNARRILAEFRPCVVDCENAPEASRALIVPSGPVDPGDGQGGGEIDGPPAPGAGAVGFERPGGSPWREDGRPPKI